MPGQPLQNSSSQFFLNLKNSGYRVYRKIISPHSKLLAGLVGFSLVIILAVSRLNNPNQGTDITLDEDYVLGLAYSWQRGQIIGRDLFFTYGPLTQFVTFLFTQLNSSGAVFSGFSLAFFGLKLLSLGSFCLAIALIRQIGWKFTAFLFLAFAISGRIEDLFSYRVWLPVIIAIGLAHTMNRPEASRRWLWSGLIGLGIVILQLFSADTGLYSLGASLITISGFGLLAYFSRFLKIAGLLPVRNYLYMALALAGGFLAGNALVSLYFTLSSASYSSFFDYQSTTLELIRAYNNTFGTEWLLPWPTTLVFALVLVYTSWYVGSNLPRLKTGPAYLLGGLLVVGIFQLKSAIVRSADTGHFTLACQPLVFLFLLLGYDWLAAGKDKNKEETASPKGTKWSFKLLDLTKRKAFWVILVVLLVATLPEAGLQSFQQLGQVATGKISLSARLSEAITNRVSPENIAPDNLAAAADPAKDILIFPYEYHIGIGLAKKVVDPSIQAYIAHSISLQEKFVAELERQKDRFEVIYGIDKFVSLPIDGVDNISRSPVIFDYIYKNFRLKTPELYGKGFMLLAPTAPRTDMQSTTLPFAVSGSVGTGLDYRFSQPASCSLLRVTTRITYPVFSFLGRPNQFNARLSLESDVLKKTQILSLQTGAEFSTYIQLFDNNKLLKVFGNEPVQQLKVDNLRVYPNTTGLFGINPTSFDLSKIECVNFVR